MSDVLRSSLVLDDLSTAYRAYLFPLVDKPLQGNQITEFNKQDDLGVALTSVYLHRNIICLQCHTTDWSISGADSGWNRTWPIWGSLENGVYGSSYGRDIREVHATLRTDIGSGAVAPWGMTNCGTFMPAPQQDEACPGCTVHDAYLAANHGPRGSIWNVETALRNGYNRLATDGLLRTAPDNNGDGLNDTVDGEAALAYLVAANIVDQTWNEVMGFPLTIANYFPRNSAQLGVLWNLTEVHFVPSRWSLKGLLVRIVTSDYYNRKSPRSTDGSTVYETPLYSDPWVEADHRFPPEALSGWMPGMQPTPDPSHNRTTDPERHNNSMGETVHRYSARNLLHSVSAALGWPEPRRFPGNVYPNAEFMKAIGQFFKDAEPGFDGVDFQGLLAWENAHGGCTKPTTSVDWINRLMTGISSFNTSNPSSPLTLEDVIQTMKDWLIADPTLISSAPTGEAMTERTALEALFGVALSSPAANVPQLESKLRSYCGVLLETPQFMLAGIAPMALGPAPRLRVCNGGPCTYLAMCLSLESAVENQFPGRNLECFADSVNLQDLGILQPDELEIICPRTLCSFIPRDMTIPVREPPPCDPRCDRIDCCGGPLPPLEYERDGYFIAWGDGAEVLDAPGVRIRPAGQSEYQSLEKGRVLKVGDLLEIPGGSRFDIRTPTARLRAPASGLPQKATNKNYYLMITGQQALQPHAAIGKGRPASKEDLEKRLQSPLLRFGEAGAPIPRGAAQDRDRRRLEPRPAPIPRK
jgi:hypothetical protein